MPWVPYRGFELDTSGGSVRFVHLKQHKPELYSNCDAECYSGSARGRELRRGGSGTRVRWWSEW